MSNLKIIDLILYEPNIYKKFKISDDIGTNTYNNVLSNIEENNKILSKTPNKNIFYNINMKEYKTERDNSLYNNNNNILNKKYNLNKKDLINYNNRNINNNQEFMMIIIKQKN